MTEEDVDEAIENAQDAVSEHGDNMDFTQEQSVEIYTSVANYCMQRAAAITREMG